MFISHHYTTAQNHYIKEPIKSFENMTKLKYLETMVKVELAFQREIKSTRDMGNHRAQNLLSSCLPPKDTNIKVTIISSFVLCGCGTQKERTRFVHVRTQCLDPTGIK
jgi:hypothetical protein